ncbi:nucleoside-diphosphate-sugar epimerase [Naviculisporaceae sp. PSN 640]
MAILLTGGTSAQTAVHIAEKCTKSKIPFVLASRRGGDESTPNSHPSESVKFDWTDHSTFPNPFSYTFSDSNEKITSVYIVMPQIPDPDKHVNPFIDYAISKGVRRFVLMAGTSITLGGPGRGQIWQYLVEKGVEYAVCRPTWFQENLAVWPHLLTIKNENKIYSAVGDAKIPFISAVDIANVAFVALTQKEAPNRDYRLVGPELLTYGEVAAKLSAALGRHIEHISLPPKEREEQMIKFGLPAEGAAFMIHLENLTASGFETHMNDVIEQVTGQKPRTVDQFIEENKAVWGQ